MVGLSNTGPGGLAKVVKPFTIEETLGGISPEAFVPLCRICEAQFKPLPLLTETIDFETEIVRLTIAKVGCNDWIGPIREDQHQTMY